MLRCVHVLKYVGTHKDSIYFLYAIEIIVTRIEYFFIESLGLSLTTH